MKKWLLTPIYLPTTRLAQIFELVWVATVTYHIVF